MAKKKQKLPRYGRVPEPPSMRLTDRDTQILEAVHAYDGLLSFAQIQRLFFTGKSQTEQRLKLLYQHGYLARPDQDQRRQLPEMSTGSIKKVLKRSRALNGTPLNEFYWRNEPRWFQVSHDLMVNDFRLDLLEACRKDKQIKLETWIPESEFGLFPIRLHTRIRKRKP